MVKILFHKFIDYLDGSHISIYSFHDSILIDKIIKKLTNNNLIKSFLPEEVTKYLYKKMNRESPEYKFIVDCLAHIVTEMSDAHSEIDIIEYDDVLINKFIYDMKKVKVFHKVEKIDVEIIEKIFKDNILRDMFCL